jgi:hypothetical protein
MGFASRECEEQLLETGLIYLVHLKSAWKLNSKLGNIIRKSTLKLGRFVTSVARLRAIREPPNNRQNERYSYEQDLVLGGLENSLAIYATRFVYGSLAI